MKYPERQREREAAARNERLNFVAQFFKGAPAPRPSIVAYQAWRAVVRLSGDEKDRQREREGLFDVARAGRGRGEVEEG